MGLSIAPGAWSAGWSGMMRSIAGAACAAGATSAEGRVAVLLSRGRELQAEAASRALAAQRAEQEAAAAAQQAQAQGTELQSQLASLAAQHTAMQQQLAAAREQYTTMQQQYAADMAGLEAAAREQALDDELVGPVARHREHRASNDSCPQCVRLGKIL